MVVAMATNPPAGVAPVFQPLIVQLTVNAQGSVDVTSNREVEPLLIAHILSSSLSGVLAQLRRQAAQETKLVIARPFT